MGTLSWYAWLALRTRVSMSAIGSVIVIGRQAFLAAVSRGTDGVVGLPRALRHTRQLARVRHLPEADPAQTEDPVDGACPAAALAAAVATHLELRLAGSLVDESGLGH